MSKNLRSGWIKYCPVCGKTPIVEFDANGEWMCKCSDPDCDCNGFIVYDENAVPVPMENPEDYADLSGSDDA